MVLLNLCLLFAIDHEESHGIDKLEVKNMLQELDLVRRLHGKLNRQFI